MKIVRMANYVGPRPGGLRTALREPGTGYLAAGHEPALIIPGRRHSVEDSAQGRVITLPGPLVPFLGGCRALLPALRSLAALAGLRAAGTDAVLVAGEDFATGAAILGWPAGPRRARARARAELFGWPAAIGAFLAVHQSLEEGDVTDERGLVARRAGGTR